MKNIDEAFFKAIEMGDYNYVREVLDANHKSPIIACVNLLAIHKDQHVLVNKCIRLVLNNGVTVNSYERDQFSGLPLEKETIKAINKAFYEGLRGGRVKPAAARSFLERIQDVFKGERFL